MEKLARNRFLIYRGVCQVWYDRRTPDNRTSPIQRKEIMNYVEGQSKQDVFNGLRFLYSKGFVARDAEGYGWVPTILPCPEEESYCWLHGEETPCIICERKERHK